MTRGQFQFEGLKGLCDINLIDEALEGLYSLAGTMVLVLVHSGYG